MGKVYDNTSEGSKLRTYCVAVRTFVLPEDFRERESKILDKEQYCNDEERILCDFVGIKPGQL